MGIILRLQWPVDYVPYPVDRVDVLETVLLGRQSQGALSSNVKICYDTRNAPLNS